VELVMDPVIDTTVRTTLALLFLVAASHKLRDLSRFRATLTEYQLLPTMFVAPVAALVVGVELAVAGALATAALRTPGLVAAAAVLVVYGNAVAVNLARGRRHIDCGCAGPATRQPISGWLVVRNTVLAAGALASLAPVRPRPLVWVDALTVVAATAVLAALYAALDRLLANGPALARLRGVA
jgi:hypothetical protein